MKREPKEDCGGLKPIPLVKKKETDKKKVKQNTKKTKKATSK